MVSYLTKEVEKGDVRVVPLLVLTKVIWVICGRSSTCVTKIAFSCVGSCLLKSWSMPKLLREQVGANLSVVRSLRTLKEGLIIDFHTTLTLFRIPLFNSYYRDAENNSLLKESVEKILVKGFIQPVTHVQPLGLYRHLFLIPKNADGWNR